MWEALAFIARQINPDVLIQCCSKKTQRETIPKFDTCIDEAESARWNRQIRTCDDEEDVVTLTREYSAIIDELMREDPGTRIVADYTSGTKAMSAALVAAGVARGISLLEYATGDRDRTGRVTRTTGTRSLSPADLVAERRLDLLGDLFNLGQYESVREEAKDLAQRVKAANLQTRAGTLAELAGVYHSWDLFDWKAAFSALKDLTCKNKEEFENAGWDVELLGKQCHHLKRCKEGKKRYSNDRIVDLLASAERCCKRGRYDDCVARLYRLIEMIGQARLADKEHGIKNTSKARLSEIKYLAPRYAEKQTHWTEGQNIKLGLRDNIEILFEAEDPVGMFLGERYGLESGSKDAPLKDLLDRRNGSLLAHGEQPVCECTAQKLLAIARDAVRMHVGNTDTLDELLRAATFTLCPWVSDVRRNL